MSDEIRTTQIVGVKGLAKIASDRVVEPATPAGDLSQLLEHLFRRHGALEKPTFTGPTRPHISSRVSDSARKP